MGLSENNYITILQSLKDKIRKARLKATIAANAELLQLYWDIGNIILEQKNIEGWGTKVTARLAKDLKSEFPEMTGLSERNLVYMQTFASSYPDFPFTQGSPAELTQNTKNLITQVSPAELQNSENLNIPIVQPPLAQLTWYHHTTLLDKVKDPENRYFYIQETIQNGWSRDVMVHQIESGLHNRKGAISSNFKTTIAPDKSELVQQLFKDPYKFDFIYLGNEAKERDLEDALTNQLTKFLLELGQYFSFMGRQYKMVLGGKEYFFDLLFYHTRLKRYIIIELKIDEFKPEYKGKMEFYLNLADNHLKQPDDEQSIGLILCKTKDGLVAEYSLRDSSKPIGIAEYKLKELLPENIRGEMPSIEELETEIDKEYEELKNPSQKRFDALKEKLAQIKGVELQKAASSAILIDLFDKSILPLYKTLITRLNDFKDMFYSCDYQWQFNNTTISSIEELAENWGDEKFLNSFNETIFIYKLNGLKKAGTEAFNMAIQLDYIIQQYWYGFKLINYKNHQPFIKKIYGELLTKEDIEKIVETVYNFIIEDIEKQVDYLKKQ